MPGHIDPLYWFILFVVFVVLFFGWMFYIARDGREISVSFSGLGANLNVSSRDEEQEPVKEKEA